MHTAAQPTLPKLPTRDTLRLKQRLCAALASFSLLGTPFILAACDDTATTSEERLTPSDATTSDTTAPTDTTQPPDTSPPPYDPIPQCGSGELTVSVEFAQGSDIFNSEEDCPSYISTTKSALGITAPDYGNGYELRLNLEATQALRDQGNTTDCVYYVTELCLGGRLLASDASQDPADPTDLASPAHVGLIAPLRPGNAWSTALADDPALLAEIAALPASVCALLASHWHTDGQVEHASVASFARATLELMQAAAPPDLIAASQHAALDEIEHAKLTLSLASRYAPASLEPAHLPAPSRASVPASAPDLASLALSVLEEGVIGESVACLALQRALDTCAFPSIRAVLATLLDDESRHAALAWATLRWAITAGGPSVADAVRGAASRLSPLPSAPTPAERPHLDPVLARHGRLSPSALFAARQDAWRDVISPMLDAALSA